MRVLVVGDEPLMADATRAAHAWTRCLIGSAGEDVVAPQDELGLGQMREDLVREVAAVPLGEDRIVRCVEEQGACKFASAYPEQDPLGEHLGPDLPLRPDQGATKLISSGVPEPR